MNSNNDGGKPSSAGAPGQAEMPLPSPATPCSPPFMPLPAALELAESGESTGGMMTHEALKTLAATIRNARAAFFADGSDRAAACRMLEILEQNAPHHGAQKEELCNQRKRQMSAPVHAVVRRQIVQASLCLRFYRSAGWTREDVRQLLREDQRLALVFPRYFDSRDKAGRGSFELDDGLPHDECDYFAVYGLSEPFSAEALAAHDIV